MKKILLFALSLVSLLTVNSCSDNEYTSMYDDPDKTTSVTCDRLMTGAFYTGRDYTYNTYWRMYTWENIFGKYAQTVGYKNGTGSVYYFSLSYANDRWKNFYNTLAQFRQLENKYNSETEAEQAKDRIYKDLAEVFVYDHLSQIVDLFGDAPFTQAGTLGITGDVASSRAAFDDDVELYRTMINRLGELYTDIQSFNGNLDKVNEALLPSQDFINDGNLDRWLAYANSLRLRLAVHVSAQGDLTEVGRAAVKECMTRKLVDSDDNQIEVYPDDNGFNYWENFRDSYKDINNVASQPMIDAMQKVSGENDPRLLVMYEPNKDGNYIGTNRSETQGTQTGHGSKFNGFGEGVWKDRYYSYLDSLTFTGNCDFISPIMSAAEVNFLKAECYQNGWASGDAKTEFVNGMVNSTKFYYRLNNTTNKILGTNGHRASYPGDATVEAYAEKLWDTYTNKLEGIMTQKWVHFGIIQPAQAWTDIRRTGYPALTYPEDSDAQAYKTIPSRILYPTTERDNNNDNYNAVKEKQGDDAYIKLFWAK